MIETVNKKNYTLSSMRKLFLSAFFLFLPFLLINELYTCAEFGFSDNDVSKFKDVPHNIQVANTGSSHGCAFDYSNYPDLTSFNFFLPNQSINYDYHIFNQYADRFLPDSVLFILVSYGQVDGIQPESQYEKIEKRYYQFLDGKNIEGYSFWKFIRFRFFAAAFDSHPFRRIRTELPKMLHGKNKADRIISREQFESEVTRPIIEKTFTSAFPRQGQEGIDYNRNYLMKMLSMCKERNIHPVIITTPLPKITNDRFDEIAPDFFDVFKQYREDTLSLAKKQGIDTVWLDYSHSEIFADNYEYFNDGSHLSGKGARFFTKLVMDEIARLGIIKQE